MGKILFCKYEVMRLIGSGGAGKVYLARDLHLNRLVAVKECGEDILSSEMELLKDLEHPGLPQVFDYFKEQGTFYLVMEYIEGMTLRQYLNRHKRVAERQAVKWAMDLCQILEYLHSRHPAIIYRDLKPENIMIRQDGEIKIIDLGAAIRYACGRGSETVCAGTPGYCPLRQWKDTRGEICWDIYSIGIVLHEMLTGASPLKPPYERRPLAEYDRSLSGNLDKIIEHCTTPDSSKRYGFIHQLEEDLRCYQRKRMLPILWLTIRRLLMILPGLITCTYSVLPLIRGIPENQFPFPYLEKPLFFLSITVLLYLILCKKTKKGILRQEKNIWLSQKQFNGLFLWNILVVEAALLLGILTFSAPVVSAEGKQEQLWVEMRDDSGRKLLLKNDAVYITNTAVRFELPADRLPEEEIFIQLVAIGEEGNTYCSRVFKVRSEQ